MDEVWRVILSYPDYEASSLGRIRRITPRKARVKEPKVLNPVPRGGGYRIVTLMKPKCRQEPGKLTFFPVKASVCVCEAFHGPRPFPRAHAAHNNGNRTDDRADNLRWATPGENSADQREHDTWIRGERHGLAKVTSQDVIRIRQMREEGFYLKHIANLFGLTESTVSGICKRKCWKHI